MDIFKYAEETLHWAADYYDFHTGYTYGVVDGKRLYDKKSIPVYEDGTLIGFVHNENER